MNTTAFLDLTIARRGRQYFVILIDALEVNEVGPFKSKKEALELYRQLARQALTLGGLCQAVCAGSSNAEADAEAA